MEKRINNKTRTYLQDFKNNIKTLVDSTDNLNDKAFKLIKSILNVGSTFFKLIPPLIVCVVIRNGDGLHIGY